MFWPTDPNPKSKKFSQKWKKNPFYKQYGTSRNIPCGYWKPQENNQNVPFFVGGEGGKINKKCPYFLCPYSRRGGGVKWEKDNVPLYELFLFEGIPNVFQGL